MTTPWQRAREVVRRAVPGRAPRELMGVLWPDAEFAVVDFEATSADPRSARPLSVGWVVVRHGRIVLATGGYTLIRFTGDVPTAGMAVHGLAPNELAAGAPTQVVARQLRSVLHGRVLVAHGAQLERALLRRLDVPVAAGSVLDTMALLPAADRRKGQRDTGAPELALAAQRHGVPVHRRHHAYGDALTTAGLFLALATTLSGDAPATVGELRLVGRARWR